MTDTTLVEAAEPAEQAPQWPMKRDTGCPFDPPPGVRRLLAQDPISKARIWDGSTPWIIARHTDQRSLLSDPRVSHDGIRDGFPHISADFKFLSAAQPSFAGQDDPEHGRIRRMVTVPFTARRIEALRPAIQKITDELIDGMLAGPKPVDLVEALALPLPVRVICEMLGVPYEDREFLQRNNNAMIYRDTAQGDAQNAAIAQTVYLKELVGTKLVERGDDIFSDLAVQVEIGEITQDDAAGIGMMLLGAGHETTANMIALGTLALLENPEQLTVVRESDDPKVIANTVEELLRYLTIAQDTVRRVAAEDIELGGVVIKAGDGIVFPLNAANWDPDVYPDTPDRLDIHRGNARRHLAFGYGVHQCLGATLARVELQIVYSTLLRRIPTLALATTIDQLPFKYDQIAHGVYELPITW
ncbi:MULTISPECIES: cytochrome P450 [unclassified Streptomyces]|uniref:cytochrome P450 n=1 Tax=unclassified Streptomyces TaxID=2593676 RepID=UPI003818D3B8